MRKFTIPLMLMIALLFAVEAGAQQLPSFAEPVFRKVENSEREAFEKRFGDFTMTGTGFQGGSIIDRLPTSEIRARLQAAFGDPTVRLEDFVGVRNVRPANSIQFEYWFVVNDSIPMMVLDIDGPFTLGLVYAGAIDYIDLMPEIKRTLSRKLMGVSRMAEFSDVFYSPERGKWFRVEYKNGNYISEEIERPARFRSLQLN